MTLVYCAMLFGVITYWDTDPIVWRDKGTVRYALKASDELNYVSAEYGHESATWGASLKKCVPATAEEQLEIIGYFVEFDGDGKVCR